MKKEKRTERVEVRLTKNEKEYLQIFSKIQDISISDLIRMATFNRIKNDSKR